jgi:hypothetical protein
MERDEILDAMRRTAEENGGKPLGTDRFERATGIGASDWIRYWSRFGDIQKDAGLEPNKLNAAYGDAYLFEKMIGLIRELKKYPTQSEQQTKFYRESTFPARATFQRIGNKTQFISKLLVHCSDKPEYADIVTILEPLMPANAAPAGTGAPVQDSDNGSYGFVYLVKGHPGEYKIGRTNLVDRRLSELGATAAIEHKLEHEIKTDDPSNIEAYWHKRFQEKRMRGEWFRLSPVDVKAFKRWKKIY